MEPQAVFSIEDIQLQVTPTNLYDAIEFDDVVEFCYITKTRKKWKTNDEDFGYTELQVMPEIQITMDEIRKDYKKTNQADWYCSIGTWGHSIIQHKYHLDYKQMAGVRTAKFKEGKLNKIADGLRFGEHMFEKVKGSRGRVAFYAAVESVLAPIAAYSNYFTMSKSDIIQVCLCEAILRYKPLHKDNRPFFEEAIAEFDERVHRVQDCLNNV